MELSRLLDRRPETIRDRLKRLESEGQVQATMTGIPGGGSRLIWKTTTTGT